LAGTLRFEDDEAGLSEKCAGGNNPGLVDDRERCICMSIFDDERLFVKDCVSAERKMARRLCQCQPDSSFDPLPILIYECEKSDRSSE
jgi:hypothetical protein